MNSTIHSQQRMQQRSISESAIAFALANGKKEYRQGRVYYLVLDSQIRSPREEAYCGVVVVTSKDGWIITAWRDRKSGYKKIRHRSRRSKV